MTNDPLTQPWVTDLFASKLTVPELPSGYISRPRLQQRLNDATSGPLTCVCALAGSGKSNATAGWTASLDDVGWLTLDTGDNEPNSFWRYLAAALEATGVRADRIGAPPGTKQFIDELAGRVVQRHKPAIVVLDDFHEIVSPTVTTGLTMLLRHASPDLRLVLLTRHNPPMPTVRYRLNGGYTEIDATELAFTVDEAVELVERSSVSISTAAIVDLVTRTQGWAAGLGLFLMSAGGADGVADRVAAFGGTDRWVAHYLAQEVFDDEPVGVRALLERTSIARRLPVGLAAELSGRADAGAVLDRLLSQNAFIESVEPRVYRYHPLFAQMLRMRLASAHQRDCASLHRSAAAWHTREGSPDEALHHAAQAEDWPLVAQLIVDEQLFVPMLLGCPNRTLVRAARGVPELDMQRDPAAAAVGAILALDAKDDPRAQALLDRVDLREHNKPVSNIGFASAAIQLRLATRRPDGADDALKYADDTLALLADIPLQHSSSRAQARCLITAERAVALISDDRLDEARLALAEALGLPACNMAHAARHLLVGLQAFLFALRGDLSRAAEDATRGLEEIGDRCVGSRASAYCHLTIALIHAERGEHAAAREELPQAGEWRTRQDALFWATADLVEQHTRRYPGSQTPPAGWEVAGEADRTPAPRLAAMQASMLIQRGEAGAAKRMLATIDTPSVAVRVQMARAMLALGEQSDALECARSVTESSVPTPYPLMVDANLVLARAGDETGNPNLAAQSLSRALRLSEQERLRRPFLEEGPWLRRSIAHLIHESSRYTWLRRTVLGRHLAEPEAGVPVPLTQALTQREHDVLNKLADTLSAEEIADDMFLSINTIKTHQRGIYSKLAVTRRRDAVRRARELGIL
jgi:LuxR family maltose regulon positive regulatory protein